MNANYQNVSMQCIQQFRIIVLTGVLTPLLLLFFTSDAEAVSPQITNINRTRHLNEETVARGYTIPSRDYDFSLGIRGGIYEGEGWVKVKEPDAEQTTVPVIPAGKTIVSNVYHYGVYIPGAGITEKPLWISFDFDSDTRFRKRVAFYNGVTDEWVEVPTKIDYENQRARAAIHFSYAIVAVFEDTGRLDEPHAIGAPPTPSFNAEAAIVVDSASGKILYEYNGNKEWWLASLTKLMTADVFLEQEPNLTDTITYTAQDQTIGARLRNISPGESFTLKDTLYTTITGSANDTAHMLGRGSGITEEAFLTRMNEQATEFGLIHTNFGDFSGLSLENRSTAREYWKVVREAARSFQIHQAATTQNYSFTTSAGTPHNIKNTNTLLTSSDLRFIVGKTGYLDESLHNFGAVVSDDNGNEVVIVVFGSPTSTQRFQAAENLATWAFANWEW